MTSNELLQTSGITVAEITSQPDIWARVIRESDSTTKVLPAYGKPVLFVGCGTSYYIGESYARRRNSLGLGRTRAAIASEIPYLDPAETIVVLSRSGTTTDVIKVAHSLRGSSKVIGIIGEAGTPLVEECHDVILLDYADEQSIVQTRFATSALTLLRASLGDDLADLPAAATQALHRELPTNPPTHVVFLGTDWSLGLAHEAALKCLEAAGAWSESYATMEYQHGPIAAADSNTLIWPLSPIPDDLAAAIRKTGAALIEPTLDPQAELVAIHRLTIELARINSRNPDQPWYLSRSVQLA